MENRTTEPAFVLQPNCQVGKNTTECFLRLVHTVHSVNPTIKIACDVLGHYLDFKFTSSAIKTQTYTPKTVGTTPFKAAIPSASDFITDVERSAEYALRTHPLEWTYCRKHVLTAMRGVDAEPSAEFLRQFKPEYRYRVLEIHKSCLELLGVAFRDCGLHPVAAYFRADIRRQHEPPVAFRGKDGTVVLSLQADEVPDAA